MVYIYLDESGDLGFDFRKKKTTKNFMVTILFVHKRRPVEKVVRSIHSNKRKKSKKASGVIHATDEHPSVCIRFCKKLAEKDLYAMTIFLNKKKVYTRLQDEKQVLYNYVVNILLDRLLNKNIVKKGEDIKLIASRRETNKYFNKNFQNYLKNQSLGNHNIKISVEIKTPEEHKCLQAVDMVSWAIFRKYEYGDDTYYNIIDSIIMEESPLFP